MEIKNKLTVTRGERERGNRGKKGKSCQGTCIKDPWTKPTWEGGLNVGGGIEQGGGELWGEMGTTVIEQK